jgi:AhpD family alkylhydroperoxidase
MWRTIPNQAVIWIWFERLRAPDVKPGTSGIGLPFDQKCPPPSRAWRRREGAILREWFAAYTSYINGCEFCAKAHVAVAAELLGSEDPAWIALRDLDASSLKEEEKALLRFAVRVSRDFPSITEADVKSLRALSWNDESIYCTITGCALFNFYKRWITASGVHAVSDEGHRQHGNVLAQKGYDPELRERHLSSVGESSEWARSHLPEVSELASLQCNLQK